MNNIQLNIVANAQFQQVYAEVAKLKEAMLSLQKASVGGPFTPQVSASIKQAQSAFDSAVLSTRAFTIEHVAMSSSVEKFGKQLKSGQLSLSNYYKIWRDSAKGVSSELDALATSQARLNRSIAIADPLRPGYAKLVTDINGVVTAQEKAVFYQKALNTALQQGSIKLIDFGKNTQWMGRQLTVGLTMPLAMFGAGVSSAFLQVDKELTRMQKVYGSGLIQPTQQALNQIRKDVLALGSDLAKTMGVSVQETASMAADLAATGLEGQNLISSTREALRLATLGELDHQQAMQATVSLQNVYKLNTMQLSDAINFLNAVENQTSTSLQDLVDAIPRVGPIVQQLGGSFKDTAAMMVAMKEAGVPAAQGANAIKSALSSLINPSTKAREAFKNFGIDLGKISSETGGAPLLMLKALSEQMKNLDRLSQAQLIEKLFGKYQFSRVQALIDNLNKSGSQTTKVFDLMGASSADLAKLAGQELKTQTESASGRFKRMVETLKADFIPIGNMFLDSFTRIGKVVDKVISAVRAVANILGPTAKSLGNIFGGGLAGLIVVGPIIMLVGLFANLIGNIMRGANAMRMFKQGMESATASENKFLAGLHGMRNFYEALDKSAIAARNQMDLMPEAITSNATAFEILRKSIYDLTLQFEALAVAQRSAMGFPTPNTGKGGVKNIPFKAPGFATGGWVPGNPSQGDIYPAMLTGKEFVVPYPKSVKYSSFLNAIMDGNLPGYSGGNGTSSATHAAHAAPEFQPGSAQWETIMNQYPELKALHEQITGSVKIVSNLVNTDVLGKLNLQLRSGTATPEDFLKNWGVGGTGFRTSAKLGGLQMFDEEHLGALKDFESIIKERVVSLGKQNIADADVYQEVQGLISEWKNTRGATRNVAEALEQAALQIGQVRVNPGKDYIMTGLANGTLEQRGTVVYAAGTDTRVGEVANSKSRGTTRVKDIQYQMKNNYTRAIAEERAIAAKAVQDQFIYDEARIAAAAATREKNDPYMVSRSKRRNSPIEQAGIDGADDGHMYTHTFVDTIEKETEQESRSSRFASKYGIASRMSKGPGIIGRAGQRLGNFKGGYGTGMAAMMVPSIMSMLPEKTGGGTDLSGLKSGIGTTASIVGMAAFIPGLQPFLLEIAAGAAIFSGLKWAFGRADVARKKFEAGVIETYAKIEKDPEKFIAKIQDQVTEQDKTATSYNKMSIYGKVYGDTLMRMVQNIGSGAIKGKQLTTTLDALNSSAVNGKTQWNAFKNAIKAAGDQNLITLSTSIDKVFGKTNLAIIAMSRLATLAASGIDPQTFLTQNGAKSLMDKDFMNDFLDKQIKTLKDQITSLQNPVNAAGVSNQKKQDALTKEIKKQELIKKELDAQLKAMQHQAETVNKINEYYNKQSDIVQQIKHAEITGNYIQAAQLKNVQNQQTSAFRAQQAIDEKQGQVDAQSELINELNAQLQALKDIQTAAEATASNAAQIKVLQGQIKDLLSLKKELNKPAGIQAKGTIDDPVVVKPLIISAENKKKTEEYLGQGAAAHVFDSVTTADLEKAGAKATGRDRWNQGTYAGQYITWQGKKWKVGAQDPLTGRWSIVPVANKAAGGSITGAGTWTSDSIPAMLSHGEFVMSSAAVSKYGLGTMYSLNNRNYEVPNQMSSSNNQNINFYISGVSDPNAVAEVVMQKLKTVNAKINKTNKVAV
ncbi:MAG: hypothetical protein RLZZ196_70 [Bacteroidota bacterium]